MSRGGSGGRTRVKTARGRTAQSTRWLERQLNDPYVKRAKAEGYRSRAAYKLIELDERFGFLKGAKRVVDLGIAPGGWAQVVRRQVPKVQSSNPRPSPRWCRSVPRMQVQRLGGWRRAAARPRTARARGPRWRRWAPRPSACRCRAPG